MRELVTTGFYFFLLLDDKVVQVINAFPRSISVNARAKLTSNCPPNKKKKRVLVLLNNQ